MNLIANQFRRIAGVRPSGLLNWEMGENPMRSRHCNGEYPIYATGAYAPGRFRNMMNPSQETCLNLKLTYER